MRGCEFGNYGQRGIVMSIIGASNRLLATCFICILLCACGGGGSQLPSSKLVVVVQNSGIQLGASEQLRAQLVRSDGSTQDATSSVNWSSSAPNIIQVSSSGVATAAATGKTTVHADSATASASADLTATKLFGVTDCCPNNFVILAPSAGNTLPPLPVGDITIGFNSASATDPVNHRFYVFPVQNGNTFSMVVIDTTTAKLSSTRPLSVSLFAAQWDQQSGNIFAITSCCPNQLVSINPTNGDSTPVSSVGDATSGFNGTSAMDQVNHRFYFIRFDASNAASLIGVDISTGSVTAQFSLQGAVPFLLAWNASTGTLVGVAGTANPPSNTFVSLNTQTGEETTVGGPLAPRDLQGWTMASAMDSVRNRFYAIIVDLGNGGPATNASLSNPAGVATDATGNLYIADTNNNRVRKVDTNGVISTFAGNGTAAFAGDGGPASNASLSAPSGVVLDALGNLYIADTNNNRVRKVDTNGVITTFTGNGTAAFAGDGGPAASASLNSPTGLVLDASGNFYIADMANNCIREVDATGKISTFAGNATSGYGGDGGPATKANLNAPKGVATDLTGNLYIADTNNNRVRKVDTNGVITTFAGNGTAAFAGDGGPASNASLSAPSSVAVDKAGILYISDTANNRIRNVSGVGVIATAMGSGDNSFQIVGIDTTSGAISESLRPPQGLILLGAE
jgi:ATP-dependent protease HslVU (ClpYQ) peptidase subunit